MFSLCFFFCFFVFFLFFFCVFFVFYFIKISKFALPGVMLMYERTSKDRKKKRKYNIRPGPEVIKFLSCSTEQSTNFQLLIKSKYRKMKTFLALNISDVVFIIKCVLS